MNDIKTELFEYAKSGSVGCTIIYFLSWLLFAILIYYKFGITQSYTLATMFFFISIGMIVLMSQQIAKEIKDND